MIPYILILCFIIITYVVISILPIKIDKRKTFINISFFELFIFLGIRDIDVGTDMINYITNFKYIATLPLSGLFVLDWEPLFIIFNKILSFFSNDTQIYIFVTTFLCLIGPYQLIKKYSI